mgnify:CR=1 FL=1
MAIQIDTSNFSQTTANKASQAVHKQVVRAEEQKKNEEQRKSRLTMEQVTPIVHELEQTASFLNKKLKFSINNELNEVVVKVVDAETDKVIKELPPEELLRISMRIREAVGLLIDEEI